MRYNLLNKFQIYQKDYKVLEVVVDKSVILDRELQLSIENDIVEKIGNFRIEYSSKSYAE